MTGDWTMKVALLGRFGAVRRRPPRQINPLQSITFRSAPEIVELIVIKTHLSREFGLNA